MSPLIALIVLVSAGCLAADANCLTACASCKTAKWYEVLYTSKNMLPRDVHALLENYKSTDPEAGKYYKIWYDSIPDDCLGQPYTSLYNGRIGTREDPATVLKNYIEYCEERRKAACEKKAKDIEEILLKGGYTRLSTFDALTILANSGDERARSIRKLVIGAIKCDSLDEMRELASLPFRKDKESKIVSSFQRINLKNMEDVCKKYNSTMQEFRRKLDNLALTSAESEKLEDLRTKAYTTNVEGFKSKVIRGILERTQKTYIKSMLALKSLDREILSACRKVNDTIGTRGESMSLSTYLSSLQKISLKIEITTYELEWIQKLSLCRLINKPAKSS